MPFMKDEPQGMLRVGPAGWAYEDWAGIVYPPAMPRGLHPLSFLCSLFDMVEVNTSFYRPLNPKHGLAWVKKVEENPSFLFTVKLWERFTHQRESWPGPEEVRVFCEGLAPIAEAGKLGTLLLQFPWSFKRTPENRQWLARAVETFSAYPLALEVRHASWNCPEVCRGLAERRVAFCNIDQPLFSDSLAPTGKVTASLGYVRLHGRNHDDWFREDAGRNERYDYLYRPDELRPWIDKISRMRKQVNDLFVVTNNHYRGQAVVNALEIQAATGRPLPALPKHLLDAYPRLRALLREKP